MTLNPLVGYGSLGAGVAAIRGLLDMIRSNRRASKALDKGKMSTDPDAIEIEVPMEKRAYFTELLASLGAAGGGYYLTDKLYQAMRRKQLAAERDRERAAFGDAVNAEADSYFKQANIGAPVDHALQIGKDSPKDLLFLAALASAAGSYGLLEHTFPQASDKNVRKRFPQRVQIKGIGTMEADGPGDGPLAQKTASSNVMGDILLDDGDRSNLLEYASALVLEVPGIHPKSAMADLLGAYLHDPDALKETMRSHGIHAALRENEGSFKYASAATEIDRRAGAAALSRDPLIKQSWAVLTCAELGENFPDMTLRALAMPRAESIVLQKLASVVCVVTRPAEEVLYQEKTAHFKQAVEASRESSTLDVAEADTPYGSENRQNRFYAGDQDPVDKLLAGSKLSTVPPK